MDLMLRHLRVGLTGAAPPIPLPGAAHYHFVLAAPVEKGVPGALLSAVIAGTLRLARAPPLDTAPFNL